MHSLLEKPTGKKTMKSIRPKSNTRMLSKVLRKWKSTNFQLMAKADSLGTDFQLALLAYRTSPHESTGGSPAQLLMGLKTRSRLPACPEMLRPQIIQHHEVEQRDKASKQKQARYYNTRNGTRPLEALETGDRVLIWDIDSRTWRIPGTLVKRLGERSYLVRLES